jgi:prevent-host-death family protein
MRTPSNDAEPIQLRELIVAARKEPVTVLENGEPKVVVLSPAEFDRLEQQDRIGRDAKARLQRTIAAMQKEAAERGLMILGPYSFDDWRTMLCIKGCIKFYVNKDPIRFAPALKKDKKMLEDFIERRLTVG